MVGGGEGNGGGARPVVEQGAVRGGSRGAAAASGSRLALAVAVAAVPHYRS
jgi:hypothetical protein